MRLLYDGGLVYSLFNNWLRNHLSSNYWLSHHLLLNKWLSDYFLSLGNKWLSIVYLISIGYLLPSILYLNNFIRSLVCRLINLFSSLRLNYFDLTCFNHFTKIFFGNSFNLLCLRNREEQEHANQFLIHLLERRKII